LYIYVFKQKNNDFPPIVSFWGKTKVGGWIFGGFGEVF